MKWLRPRRPSPALIISVIALLLAMGGTGYAALKLPKNSVGTKQLKKNAVTTAKIKNNAVTGAKVRNGSLTGADIKLGTLGTVPSAANANALQGHPASDFQAAGQMTRFLAKANDGQEVILGQHGPFQAIGHCDSSRTHTLTGPDGSTDSMFTVIGIRNIGVNGAHFDSSDDDDANTFDTGEQGWFDFDDPGDTGTAVAPNGVSLTVIGGAAVDTHVSTLSGFGADCLFSGLILTTDGYTG